MASSIHNCEMYKSFCVDMNSKSIQLYEEDYYNVRSNITSHIGTIFKSFCSNLVDQDNNINYMQLDALSKNINKNNIENNKKD
jgi:hypothetical protein